LYWKLYKIDDACCGPIRLILRGCCGLLYTVYVFGGAVIAIPLMIVIDCGTCLMAPTSHVDLPWFSQFEELRKVAEVFFESVPMVALQLIKAFGERGAGSLDPMLIAAVGTSLLTAYQHLVQIKQLSTTYQESWTSIVREIFEFGHGKTPLRLLLRTREFVDYSLLYQALSEEHLNEIGMALINNSRLIRLVFDVSTNHISSEGLASVIRVLRRNTKLTTLEIRSRNCSSRVRSSSSTAIRVGETQTVEALVLGPLLSAFKEGLERNTSLERLLLSCITYGELSEVVELTGTVATSHVKELTLRWNPPPPSASPTPLGQNQKMKDEMQ